jgi:hypothetical protein
MSTLTPTDSDERPAVGSESNSRLRTRVMWGAGLPVGLLLVSYAVGREAQGGLQAASYVLLILAGVAAGGALGGLVIHLTARWRHRGGWRAWIATLIAGLLYLTAVVTGFILGLSGPH